MWSVTPLASAMLLLCALALAVLLAARLRHRAGRLPTDDASFEAAVLALGEEVDWRDRNRVRRRYAPPPVTLGFRARRRP